MLRAVIFLLICLVAPLTWATDVRITPATDITLALLCKVRKYQALEINYSITISNGSLYIQSSIEEEQVERKYLSFKLSDAILQIDFIENHFIDINPKNPELYRTETHKIIINRFSGFYLDKQKNKFYNPDTETGPFLYQGKCEKLDKKF